MKKIFLLIVLAGLFVNFSGFGQSKDNPWTNAELKKTAALATELQLPKDQRPVVIDIGPAGVIKGAIEVGPAEYDKNKAQLKEVLKDLPKDKEVVIYCGCCPFSKCPNVRPAFNILVDMGFEKPRLLNLYHNLKVDWIDKGFPLAQE
ncbi:MAG TPA: rhodanese-like domain-containing protein [Chitinophagaceae bacterium]|nr:rhodanese-like domain-containing protein [Chitinophagaceae bacterium]